MPNTMPSRYVPAEHTDPEWFEPLPTCSHCEKETPRTDMRFTTDCQGITYRLVCHDCYDMLMEKGYDGEYYNELDECIDDEY